MKILNFGFRFAGGASKIEELEKIFNEAPQWLRYAGGRAWLVQTDQSAIWWTDKIQPLLGPTDSLLIFEVDLKSRWGVAEKWVWDWIDARMQGR
jgi:hypothetical protein